MKEKTMAAGTAIDADIAIENTSVVKTDKDYDNRFSVIDGKMLWSDHGITIVCTHDEGEWTYHVTKGGTVITRKIRSKKSPQEDDPRVRDAQIKKSMGRSGDTDDIDVVFDAMNDFGLFLMEHDEIMEMSLAPVTDRPKQTKAPIDAELVAQAMDILKNGDPVKFIMDEFHVHHIGDDDYGRLLLLAIASQHVMNTHGIHLTPSGASGKGKSHAGKTMLHLMPHEYWVESSLSAKAPYYMGLQPRTIIFSDDSNIDEELMSTIRRCITNFTSPVSHQSVDGNRKGVKLTIPERIIWIIASVENFMDEQTRNRMIDVPVDESEEIDELVFKKQVEDAKTAQEEFPETHNVSVCREIFRILKSLDPVSVAISFADDIIWTMKSNRRSFEMFKELVKAFAVIRNMQRSIDGTGSLNVELEDFDDAKTLYLARAEGEESKLTDGERLIVRALEDYGECTEQELIKITKLSQTTLHYRLHGRSDRGQAGLLNHSKNLIFHYKESRRINEETTRMVNVYDIAKSRPLSHYLNVVSLRSEKKSK